ncbi:MAG: 2-oxoacid:acceptor oxidoreductase subunit alpha [Gemmatimonadota bacterium]|nr:2-oxoacid:acceptor oxidoreductase subunit alpha [Gemmatimonadota bacterium]MDH5759851.1 2-oxoacid:acceptor oxidoreductase subunit alpha [Gemmatimonadota bacterium]
MREFIDGAEAIARAAIHAGCDFFAGYPITPATPILLHMARELPKVGGVAIQGEDEIASMGFCIGAALTGSRVLTATSGPGVSLYSENVGLAIMGEVPMVIVDAQRMGPATGGATTVAQGDIQFLRWGTSGGFPVIVLAPTNVAECYSLTLRAFDLAERFRVPVFLATDKETVLSRATVDVAAWEAVPVRPRVTAPADEPFVPYPQDAPGGVPAMSPIGGAHLLRFTTSSHDERGYLTKSPAQVDGLNRRLTAKIEDHMDEIGLVELDLEDGADTLVLSYGITARSVKEAVRRARGDGVAVSSLTVHSLWPVPEGAIRAVLDGVSRVVVPELNLGQYIREIERLCDAGVEVAGVHRVDGELITPEQILQAVGREVAA